MEALAAEVRIESLSCEEGACVVEYLHHHRSDWTQDVSNTPLSASLRKGGRPAKDGQLAVGDAVELNARIVDGYRPGDLIWVALPPCLSRVEGGGQVKTVCSGPGVCGEHRHPSCSDWPVVPGGSKTDAAAFLRLLEEHVRRGADRRPRADCRADKTAVTRDAGAVAFPRWSAVPCPSPARSEQSRGNEERCSTTDDETMRK